MTWATKNTNKKRLELVPDKDPTCGGLVPLPPATEVTVDLAHYADYTSPEAPDPTVYYDKAALDVIKEDTDKYPWDHSDHSEVYELRKDIANLRREISELREVFRRATRPEFLMYGGSTSPYPDTISTSELRLPYETYVGGAYRVKSSKP
jgi:hypothetical protein